MDRSTLWEAVGVPGMCVPKGGLEACAKKGTGGGRAQGAHSHSARAEQLRNAVF